VHLLVLPSAGKVNEKLFLEAIAALARASASQDHFKAINGELLQLLRGDNPIGRASAVKCEVLLTKSLGEEWLALLPEMLPVIAELLEDDDDIVGRETRAWVRAVEEETGESMDSMLS
jgi:U3 small nucleolar RNA-associated protein 10